MKKVFLGLMLVVFFVSAGWGMTIDVTIPANREDRLISAFSERYNTNPLTGEYENLTEAEIETIVQLWLKSTVLSVEEDRRLATAIAGEETF